MPSHESEPIQTQTNEDAIIHETTSGLTVRRAQLGDLDSLRPILEQWVRDPATGDVLDAEVADTLDTVHLSIGDETDKRFFVADIAGEPVGLMGLARPGEKMRAVAKTERPLEIINAYVDGAHRGSGIGAALVEELEASARSGGASELVVNSGPRYEETGWGFWTHTYGEPTETLHDYYGEGYDAQAWRHEL